MTVTLDFHIAKKDGNTFEHGDHAAAVEHSVRGRSAAGSSAAFHAGVHVKPAGPERRRASPDRAGTGNPASGGERSGRAGRLRVDFEDEAKIPILEHALENEYAVLHYSGHGISPENGGGLLEDAEGKRRPAAVSELLSVMEKGIRKLRLAVISGCKTAKTLDVKGFADLARGLIRKKVPAVIAMQFSITDRAGLKFSEVFYNRVTEGAPVEKAMNAARRALLQSDNYNLRADALAPVLFASCPRPSDSCKNSPTCPPPGSRTRSGRLKHSAVTPTP